MSIRLAPNQVASEHGAVTVDAIIDQPSGPCNQFGIDHRRRILRLSGIAAEYPQAAANAGYLPATAGQGVAPLRALILARLPLPPGCLVEGRPIGMVEHGPGVVLLAAVADPCLAEVRYLSELTAERLSGLAAQVQALDPSAGSWVWLDGDAATERIQAQVERAKRANAAAAQSSRATPIWRTGDHSAPRATAGEAEAHTIAEYAIPRLPLRFQEYIARMLLPEERILLFVHRPAFALRRRLRLFGGRQAREGILVVTDRQLLFMEDTLPPGMTMVHWGYAATLSAVERILRAEVTQERHGSSLHVALASATGEETLHFDFPEDFASALQEAAALLNAFVVRTPARAPPSLCAGPARRPAPTAVGARAVGRQADRLGRGQRRCTERCCPRRDVGRVPRRAACGRRPHPLRSRGAYLVPADPLAARLPV